MGGRVGCHVALEEKVAGVICLGYPLQSGATGAMRDEVLLALRTPILFVQGSRDALCPLDKLAAVRARMTAPSTLLVVEGGNHSLEVSAAQREGDRHHAGRFGRARAGGDSARSSSMRGRLDPLPSLTSLRAWSGQRTGFSRCVWHGSDSSACPGCRRRQPSRSARSVSSETRYCS